MSQRGIRRSRERDLARHERRRARRAKLATAAAIGAATAVAVPAQAQADTFNVTTLADEDGTGAETSLREAITSANHNAGPDTVTFAPSLSGDITLTKGELEIYYGPTDIQGPGAEQITVDGDDASRVFNIQNDSDVSISGLTVTGGRTVYDTPGGGIYVGAGSLTITGSTISGNSTAGYASEGGGIYSDHSFVMITGSTISDNSTSGAFGSGGGISARGGSLTIADSTISGNSASGPATYGAGIFVSSGSMLTVDSATIADNHVYGVGGGIVSYSPSTLTNTIVADNTAQTGNDLYNGYNGSSPPFALTSSLVEDTSDATYTADSASITGQDPQLLPLTDNGGPTETQAIPKTSPAFDSGATDLPEDQRGIDRPQYVADDMGAFELDATEEPPPSDTELLDPFAVAAKTQHQKGERIVIKLRGGAGEAVDGLAAGELWVKAHEKKKSLPLEDVSRSSAARERLRYKLHLADSDKDAKVFKLLDEGKPVRANVFLKLTDKAGNSFRKRFGLRVRLKSRSR